MDHIDDACSIDILTQEPFYPEFAYNNTYGIQAVNETIYRQALDNFYKPGGCRDRIIKCQDLAAKLDSDDSGDSNDVNAACRDADQFCWTNVEGLYLRYGDVRYNQDMIPLWYHLLTSDAHSEDIMMSLILGLIRSRPISLLDS